MRAGAFFRNGAGDFVTMDDLIYELLGAAVQPAGVVVKTKVLWFR